MCCCNDNTILKITNFLVLFASLALGVTAAILSAFLIISPLTAAIAEAVMFAIALVVGLIGLIALFFPCSLKCGYTRTSICRYFGKLTLSIIGVITVGLIVIALNLLLSLIATPIFLGLMVFFFFYLLGNLILFAYYTVDGICDRPSSQEENSCGCNYLR